MYTACRIVMQSFLGLLTFFSTLPGVIIGGKKYSTTARHKYRSLLLHLHDILAFMAAIAL